MDLTQRPRRLRGSETATEDGPETRISKASLIYPAFVAEGLRERQEIAAMPGQYRHTRTASSGWRRSCWRQGWIK